MLCSAILKKQGAKNDWIENPVVEFGEESAAHRCGGHRVFSCNSCVCRPFLASTDTKRNRVVELGVWLKASECLWVFQSIHAGVASDLADLATPNLNSVLMVFDPGAIEVALAKL
jgi:hypothetical protein